MSRLVNLDLEKSPAGLAELTDLADLGQVFLHACCGPCSLMCVKGLRDHGLEVSGFFFNPNIHPADEYALRRQAMARAADYLELPMYWEPDTLEAAPDPQTWLTALGRNTVFKQRCPSCYRERLERTAATASSLGFRAFSTSLLYSRYQLHEKIVETALACADEYGLSFVYSDFRRFWNQGIELSKEIGLYRQKWCGCILSRDEAAEQRAARAI